MNEQLRKTSRINEYLTLRNVSSVYKNAGVILFIISLAETIQAMENNKVDSIVISVAMLFSSLFLLFAGLVGIAIDDIRNNTKNKLEPTDDGI